MRLRLRLASLSARLRRGFTLIELAVVLAILAILAMLLVPRLAFIRTMSMYVNEATAIQDTVQNMLTYHATQAVWPDHFDSLLDGGTGSPTTLYGSGSGDTYGLDTNLAGVLTTTQLTANQLKSLSGLLGQPNGSSPATVTLMDHDTTITKPSSSAVGSSMARVLSGTPTVATINYTSATAPSDPNAASATVIWNSVYPNGAPTTWTETIVALGVGPACTAVNKTIITPPQCYMKDDTRYGRTIVLVRVRSDGVQASLAGGLSPDGRTLDQCLGNYRVTAQR